MNPESSLQLTTESYVEHLLADAERFATVLDGTPLDTPVPTCPGWDISRLAQHTGQIHRWANFCASHGRAASADEAAALESYDPTIAGEWFRDGAAALADTLRSLDPAAPTWHPFPVEQVAGFWPRRMAHESAVHRWDAEVAAGVSAGIDAAVASDGIDEYFEIVAPRLIAGGRAELPSGTLHVHCTDVPGEWLLSSDAAGEYQMIRAHQKGDAALRGPAMPILLKLWGRQSDGADQLSPIGDESVLDAWLAIGGV